MPPLVSIIIPTYNRAHIIDETLESIAGQTYQDWECIVVDDGSTDTTKDVITIYTNKDARFKFFSRPAHKPKGANACRNYGYEKSKGTYIQWFDSDDIMRPEKLQIKINHAIANTTDIIVDTHTTVENLVLKENPKIEVFESANFYIDYILGKKSVITNDVMVKRAVIGSHRFDENLHKAQEYEFFTRLFEQKLRYCFVDLPLTYYRQTQDSISKSNSKGKPLQVESLIYLSKIMRKRHCENPLLLARAERLGRKMYKSLIKRKDLKTVVNHYQFFRKVHHKSSAIFPCFLLYNFITGRGFDIIKPKMK